MNDDLTRTFRERADAVVDSPLTYGDVRGRARQIRRRRAAGVAGGLALVAAVLVPIALLGGSGADKADPDPTKPSPTTKQPVYEGRVTLNRDFYQVSETKYPLRYGMTATAEVVVRERRLIDLWLDPFRNMAG